MNCDVRERKTKEIEKAVLSFMEKDGLSLNEMARLMARCHAEGFVYCYEMMTEDPDILNGMERLMAGKEIKHELPKMRG